MGINNETQQLAKRDNIDHSIGQLKTKGMLSGSECVVTRCKVKDENALMKDQVKESDKQLLTLKKELEFFHDKLEKDLELDPDKKKELLEKAMQNREVQIQYKIAMEYKDRIADFEDKLQQVTDEYADYKADQDSIMTNFQADKRIQEKVKLINALREKYDRMSIIHDKLQIEIDKADIMYRHLAEEHNDKFAEYKLLRSKVKQLKMIQKKGMKLKPLKDITPGKIIKRKKLWGIF